MWGWIWNNWNSTNSQRKVITERIYKSFNDYKPYWIVATTIFILNISTIKEIIFISLDRRWGKKRMNKKDNMLNSKKNENDKISSTNNLKKKYEEQAFDEFIHKVNTNSNSTKYTIQLTITHTNISTKFMITEEELKILNKVMKEYKQYIADSDYHLIDYSILNDVEEEDRVYYLDQLKKNISCHNQLWELEKESLNKFILKSKFNFQEIYIKNQLHFILYLLSQQTEYNMRDLIRFIYYKNKFNEMNQGTEEKNWIVKNILGVSQKIFNELCSEESSNNEISTGYQLFLDKVLDKSIKERNFITVIKSFLVLSKTGTGNDLKWKKYQKLSCTTNNNQKSNIYSYDSPYSSGNDQLWEIDDFDGIQQTNEQNNYLRWSYYNTELDKPNETNIPKFSNQDSFSCDNDNVLL